MECGKQCGEKEELTSWKPLAVAPDGETQVGIRRVRAGVDFLRLLSRLFLHIRSQVLGKSYPKSVYF